jgi:hypothetical protein
VDLTALLQTDGIPVVNFGADSTLHFVLDAPEQQLDTILRRLTRFGAPITDIQLTRPTLEDVFIKVARGEI